MDISAKGVSKTIRIISLIERLNSGEVIVKKKEAEKFNVNQKTVQRDLEDIRAYFAELFVGEKSQGVVYDKKKGGYLIDEQYRHWLRFEEVLVIAKVLLESRAFVKREMDNILEKLIKQCHPDKRNELKLMLSNERYHYTSVRHSQLLCKKIWEIGQACSLNKKIELIYKKTAPMTNLKRRVLPLAIIFSEFYFYLIARIENSMYEFPALYRLDRIEKYDILNEHFSLRNHDRFEEGEFRKRVQFMHAGPLIRLKFKYWGTSLEAVLDRLPTANILKQEAATYFIEAEVFGTGVKMWLMSQLDKLEVLAPQKLRLEMINTLENMLTNYQKAGVK